MPGMEVIVFSRTLAPAARKGVRIVADDPRAVVAALKGTPGRDLWLYGGGALFRSLLDAGLVDSVEVAVVPVLLGSGERLFAGVGDDLHGMSLVRTVSTPAVVHLKLAR